MLIKKKKNGDIKIIPINKNGFAREHLLVFFMKLKIIDWSLFSMY